MQLQLSTWIEVESYLGQANGIIVPIGSTEQHGPNGLIGTDAICPEAIARRIGDQTGAMVAPTFNVGVAQHHMAFPGTMTLRPSTMIAALRDWVESLNRHGFESFYFLNGHGGNIATIQAAFAEIYGDQGLAGADRNRSSVRCMLRNWWMMPGVRRLSEELFGAKEGSHATPSEVSVTYFACPEAMKQVVFDRPAAPSGPIRDAEDFRRRHPDGRMGSDPSVASPELGGRLVETAVRELSEDYNRFLSE